MFFENPDRLIASVDPGTNSGTSRTLPLEKRSQTHNWWFLGFLGGVVTGVILGLFTAGRWEDHGPYGTQIWIGLFGLIAGGVGIMIGLAYQIFTSHRK